jgi:hypothetical protein
MPAPAATDSRKKKRMKKPASGAGSLVPCREKASSAVPLGHFVAPRATMRGAALGMCSIYEANDEHSGKISNKATRAIPRHEEKTKRVKRKGRGPSEIRVAVKTNQLLEQRGSPRHKVHAEKRIASVR